MVTIKSKKEIELMREACRVTALVHEELKKNIRPGITTLELDRSAERVMRENGGFPAEKGYDPGIKGVPPFPGSICVSINDEVIHGIPSSRVKLREGDVVSIDLVVLKDGFTEQAFYEGIKYAKKGNRIGDVCHAIGEFVHKNGYSVVREFQGHGIGRQMHEDPGIPNYGKPGRGIRLEPGMTLAIEPMVIQGKPDILELDDGWTIVTEDCSLSAHYENTILITENEPEILTLL